MAHVSPAEQKALIGGVFERAAPTYDQVGVEFFGPASRALVAATRPVTGERVLDVGCGRGASALLAARAVGPTGAVTATDIAPTMVAGLRSEAADLPWLTAEVGDAAAPRPGPWDVVQAGLVLFFLPDLGSALDLHRAGLSPSGRLGFTWFGAADDSWADVYGAVVQALPEHERPPITVAREGDFSSVERLESVLRERGFGRVATEEHRITVTLPVARTWWDWVWSQGFRVVLEAHERLGTLGEVRDEVQPLLDQRQRDGRLSWWTDIRVTVARP